MTKSNSVVLTTDRTREQNLTLSLAWDKIDKLEKETVKKDRLIAKQRDVLCEAATLLMNIRYQTWPKGASNWLPQPEEFDEVLHNVDKLIPARYRAKDKLASTNKTRKK